MYTSSLAMSFSPVWGIHPPFLICDWTGSRLPWYSYLQKEQKTVPEQEEVALPPPPPIKKSDHLDQKGLDELLKFINGTEEAKNEDTASTKRSAKIAKRARQKQRKVFTGN